MSRIVLATTGSMGDLHPYIAVALGLKARGHEAVVASAACYRSKVEGEGLEFAPVRPDVAPTLYAPEVFRRANDLKTGTQYLLKELVLPYVQHTYDDLLEACRGADLLVIHPLLFPAPVVAEKLGLRWLSVMLAPGSLGSVYDPPVLPPLPWLHALRHLGGWPHSLIIPILHRLMRSWMKPIDELRARVGLPPSATNPLIMFSPFGTQAWFSGVLGSRQPDWPVNTEVTGFVFYDRLEAGHAMEPSLRDFLDAGDPPIVFTLGSSAVMDPGEFYDHSIEAVRLLGRRAVLLTGAGAATSFKAALPPNVFAAGYAPYSELFSKAAAVVHQGGIGTTAQALRAGVPMLVVPFMYDQPDNAFRVTRLGVAKTISRKKYNAQRAAATLRELLQNPSYRERSQEAAQQMLHEDGVAGACATLERHAAGA